MAAREYAIWKRHKGREWIDRRWVHTFEDIDVRVMVRAEGYAMVRRHGCMPFAVSENELRPAPDPEAKGVTC